MMKKKAIGADPNRYFMASVKLGPKGQIVIPKEAREMFGFAPGDTIVLLADKKKGIALQPFDKLNAYLKQLFLSMEETEEAEE